MNGRTARDCRATGPIRLMMAARPSGPTAGGIPEVPAADGGVLVLPAAARYRNIKLALPVTQSGDSQLDLFSGSPDA